MQEILLKFEPTFEKEIVLYDNGVDQKLVGRVNGESVVLIEELILLKRVISIIFDFQVIDSERKFSLLEKYPDKLCQYVTKFDIKVSHDVVLEFKHIDLFKEMWPRLTSLSVISSFSEENLHDLLKKCQKLTKFSIYRCSNFNEKHLIWLEAERMKSVSINLCKNVPIQNHLKCFKGLESLELLNHLEFSSEKIWDSRLKHLSFQATSLECVKKVIDFPKLESIDLSHISSFSLSDFKILLKAIGPSLKSLRLTGDVELEENKFITDKYMTAIAEYCTGLEALYLCGCLNVSSKGLAQIDFSKMRHFSAEYCVDLEDFNFLETAQASLISLNLKSCYKISKDQYKCFLNFKFSNMQNLNLSEVFRRYNGQSPELLKDFLLTMKHLELLDLSYSNITMEVFENLKMPDSLKRISLHACTLLNIHVLNAFNMDLIEEINVRAIQHPFYLFKKHPYFSKLIC